MFASMKPESDTPEHQFEMKEPGQLSHFLEHKLIPISELFNEKVL